MTQVNVSRRTLAKGMAWTVPAVAVASAAPATAASGVTIAAGVPTVGYVGEAYTPLNNAVSGGTGPYRWSAAPGSLPAGLDIDPATGAISGQPTAVGQSQVTLQVKDASGATATASLAIAVGANRQLITDAMLATINAARASITSPTPLPTPLGRDNSTTVSQTWVEGLAKDGSALAHPADLPSGYFAENLAQGSCGAGATQTDPSAIGSGLANQWLAEPHSYADFAAKESTNPEEAWEMYYGKKVVKNSDGYWVPATDSNGKTTPSSLYPQQSGHRINLESPDYTSVNLGVAMSGIATPGCSLAYYGGADFK